MPDGTSHEFSVAIPGTVDRELSSFLLCNEGEEELVFALWYPSRGADRLTALVESVVYPLVGDRQRHGNVSFNGQYFERVLRVAMERQAGIAFLHSHLGPGWQGMSRDDVIAERRLAETVYSVTDLPLFGLTLGTDGAWSARAWEHAGGHAYERNWCSSVRVAGPSLEVTFADHIVPPPSYRELFRRTATVWGRAEHRNFTRLRVGIVGLGSVGMLVAEMLARSGFTRFVLLDFDEVQPHNLDRLIGATERDVGRLKIEIARRQIERCHTADSIDVRAFPLSVVEPAGYHAALDCDVLFSCVDRPRAREVLNHFALAHVIPVIDGGIAVWFNNAGSFTGVDWQVQTVTPDRPCLECIGAYTTDDADTERAGKLDDPSYLKGLPATHHFKRNENVIAFSANLASLEVLHLVALVTSAGGQDNFGIQRFRYVPGILESDILRHCRPACPHQALIAQGDRFFHLAGVDHAAVAARDRQQSAMAAL